MIHKRFISIAGFWTLQRLLKVVGEVALPYSRRDTGTERYLPFTAARSRESWMLAASAPIA